MREPYGLQDQVEFAAKRGKPVSYPEWGLFRNGDNPEFVQRMVEWMRTHDTAYQTVTDYCPHGFFECDRNPRSAARFKQLMSGSKGAPAVVPTAPPAPVQPIVPPRPPTPSATPGAPSVAPGPSASPSPAPSATTSASPSKSPSASPSAARTPARTPARR